VREPPAMAADASSTGSAKLIDENVLAR